MKSGMPRIAWVLAGLLLFSVALLVLGNRQALTNPDSNSYGPSGTRAFRSVAEKLGFQTRSANVIVGKPDRDEVIVAFFVEKRIDPADSNWRKLDRTNQVLYRHLESGGSVLFVTLPRDFRGSSRAAIGTPTELAGPSGAFKGALSERKAGYLEDGGPTYTLLSDGTERIVWVTKIGKGRAVIADGLLGFTNRFIDKDDNGAIVAWTLSAAAHGSRRIVFYEATHNGAGDPSLVELIGPWAAGAWWQLNLVFVLLVLTLGVRFGLPMAARQVQGGSRDLADALADTLARSNKYMVAFRAIVKESDRLVRKRLKIAGDVPAEVRDRMLPESLAAILSMAESACGMKPPREEALSMIRRLDMQVSQFVGETGRRLPSRRRR